MFAANACYLIPLLSVAAIGVLLSTTTRNSAAAVVGTVGFVILLYIVAQIPGIEGLKPYLLTEQFENWHGLLRTPTDWTPIWHSAWVCALYAVPSLFAAYLVFPAAGRHGWLRRLGRCTGFASLHGAVSSRFRASDIGERQAPRQRRAFEACSARVQS